ncbi:thioredoxin reductase aclD [Trichoderma asperellum]|uniref:Thioredoxin reductase aclD n=1 Tax=Trichoderma asperellum TaxID=101201 RepID=A0A6V8R1Q4_TRIAP|nr:thioredoxin reductase aclD [Trichoderma asperellum]
MHFKCGEAYTPRDPIAIAAWLLSIVSLAHDGESPEQFRAGAREQLRQKYPNIVMAEGEMIVQARQVDFSYQRRNLKGFRLQSEGGRSFYGRKLIWAAGARDCFPEDVPGFAACWPSHIHHCLFCDGLEQIRERPEAGVAVASLQPARVVILTNGDIPEYEQEAVDKALRLARGVGCTVENRRISQLRLSDATESSLVTVDFSDGSHDEFLVEELGLELEDTPHLGTTIKRREPCGETNIPGLYVTGDAGTHAKQIVIAMAQGGYAADSLWGELLTEDAEWRIQEAGGGAGV